VKVSAAVGFIRIGAPNQRLENPLGQANIGPACVAVLNLKPIFFDEPMRPVAWPIIQRLAAGRPAGQARAPGRSGLHAAGDGAGVAHADQADGSEPRPAGRLSRVVTADS